MTHRRIANDACPVIRPRRHHGRYRSAAYRRLERDAGAGRGEIDTAFYPSKIMGFDNPTCSAAVFADRSVAERDALSASKEAAFRGMLGRLDPTPGLADLLDWADAKGVPKAVVINAPRADAETMLLGLGWLDRFSVLVIGDERARGKACPTPVFNRVATPGRDSRGRNLRASKVLGCKSRSMPARCAALVPAWSSATSPIRRYGRGFRRACSSQDRGSARCPRGSRKCRVPGPRLRRARLPPWPRATRMSRG